MQELYVFILMHLIVKKRIRIYTSLIQSKNWSTNLIYSFPGWYNQSDPIYTKFKRTKESKKEKQHSKYITYI